MRAVQLTAPDGTAWDVRSFRVRLPAWRQFSLPVEEPEDVSEIVLDVVAAPFVMLLLPLVCAIAELPLAVARAVGSDVAWVEAAAHFPNEDRRLWRTTRADRAVVVGAVVEALSSGTSLPIPRAEPVRTT